MRVEVVSSDYTAKKYVFIDSADPLGKVIKRELPDYNKMAVEDGDEKMTDGEFLDSYLTIEKVYELESESGLVYVDDCGHYI